jgi:hypothetical protein
MGPQRTWEGEVAPTVADRLRAWKWSPNNGFLREVAQTNGGAELLLKEAEDEGRLDRVHFVAALGAVHGTVGREFLRNLVLSNSERDLRCTALVALINRKDSTVGNIASSIFDDRSPAVRDYAVLGLAIAGGDDRWDEALERIKKLWRRPPTVGLGPIPRDVLLLCYLLENATSASQRESLAQEMKRSWSGIDPKSAACIEEVWPMVQRMDGVGLRWPDPSEIRDWVIEHSWLRF